MHDSCWACSTCSASASSPTPRNHEDHRLLGDRQRRRRRVDVRRPHLPRPRHLHVHPRRRNRPRTRLGSPRRDLARQGGTRGLRRAARLVRPRRPRSGHPSGPQPDAAGRLSAFGGDRGAVQRAGRPAHACCPPATTAAKPTSSSPIPIPASAGRSTSRSGGCATARRCRRTASRSSAPTRPRPAPGVTEAIAAADVVLLAPSNPGGEHRFHPRDRRHPRRAAVDFGAR